MIIIKSYELKSSLKDSMPEIQKIFSGKVINKIKLDYFQFSISLNQRPVQQILLRKLWHRMSHWGPQPYCKLPNTTGGMLIVKIPESSWNDERVNMTWPYVGKMGNEAFCFHRPKEGDSVLFPLAAVQYQSPLSLLKDLFLLCCHGYLLSLCWKAFRNR